MNKKIILFIFLVAMIIIAALVVINKKSLTKEETKERKDVSSTETETSKLKEAEVKEFKIDAFRFGYNPDNIKVKKGDRVKIKINNTDTLHGIRIPDLNLKGSDLIEFVADKTGEFKWFCNNFCGEGHREMQGTLIVE